MDGRDDTEVGLRTVFGLNIESTVLKEKQPMKILLAAIKVISF